MEQLFKIIARGNDSDARAHRHLARFKIGKRRLLDALAQLFGRSNRPLGRRLSRQKHDEFLATIPRHHIALARILSQKLRKLPQNLVATLVAIYVVTSLKKVDVEHDHRQRPLQSLRTDKLPVQILLIIATVEYAREPVELRHFLEPLIEQGTLERNRGQIGDAAQTAHFFGIDDALIIIVIGEYDAKDLVFEHDGNASEIAKSQKPPRHPIVIRRLDTIDKERQTRRNAMRYDVDELVMHGIHRLHRMRLVDLERKPKQLPRQMLRLCRILAISVQKRLQIELLGFYPLPNAMRLFATPRPCTARYAQFIAPIPRQKQNGAVEVQAIAVRYPRQNDVQNPVEFDGLQHRTRNDQLKRQFLNRRRFRRLRVIWLFVVRFKPHVETAVRIIRQFDLSTSCKIHRRQNASKI